ncbi:MAG: hypothetical protein EXR98_06205 [Gemmataceae bacterium]|nr:hypothetical protein [Gemmataceae bacterium]
MLEVVNVQPAGVCRCRYWHRYRKDAISETPGGLGYRTLRTPTVQSPVKVQLLDDTVNLKNQLDLLKRRDSEDNRNQTKTLVVVSCELLRLHSDAAGFVGVRK